MSNSPEKMLQPAHDKAVELLTNTRNWIIAESSNSGDAHSPESLAQAIVNHFSLTLGQDINHASAHYLYSALALAVRDQMMNRWRMTRALTEDTDTRRTCYLSLEFLMGRSLSNAVNNLDLDEPVKEALHHLGASVESVESLEHDAGLGNGGLGRLAACFMDSCATLGLPVTGYGLRYRYGMFRQELVDGYQTEHPDNWLRNNHVWEIERPEFTCHIKFGGQVHVRTNNRGLLERNWVTDDQVLAVPYDVPVPGYQNSTVNTLRLWSASATDEFNLSEFNAGGYTEAVSDKTAAENITMVLYPNDASENGKVLRLRQQYFLVSASLQDAIRIWLNEQTSFEGFAQKHCFQMNDTHPSLAVAELMRLLVDEHEVEWDDAWAITASTMAYTNHTLLPEALECWSLSMLEALLPRPTEIIHELNRRFLLQVSKKWPGDTARQATMSVVSFDEHPVVRMAHLAIIGSFSINGVARLHSQLLQQGLFNDFYTLWPERFNNKTNGVTQRRWLSHCNTGLRNLLNDVIGRDWVTDLDQLEKLVPHANEPTLQKRWLDIKTANKQQLATLVQQRTGVSVDATMLFDVQVKRMHEYKRQLLCAMHAVHNYLQIINGETDMAPRFILIGGKAAPGYYMAKAIVRLITSVSDVINNDPRTKGRLRMVFFPDYNVSAMEVICPAADLSEQISTAGKEASGTGNMKFMMNGALTIGTLDGANVEILEAVGEENFFRFGLDVDEVETLRSSYSPAAIIAVDNRVQAIVQAFESGMFGPDDDGMIANAIAAATSSDDPWMTIADLPGYLDAQAAVSRTWQDQAQWTRMSILNTANSGRFSTDRTMQDYNREIWQLTSAGGKSLKAVG